jgi:hypothetical protein
MMTTLPCPFCGSTSIDVMNGSTFRWRFACCMDCGAQAGEVRAQTLGEGTPAEWEIAAKARAIEEWNVRAPVESLQAALAAEYERGRSERKCVGAASPSCHYFAPCGDICNKCGKVHTLPRSERDAAERDALWAAADCRLCANFTTKSGGCVSLVQCVDGSQYKATPPRQYWRSE